MVDIDGDGESFDVTPDPSILIALTFGRLSWLDAICELVDNSIDSFGHALRMGEPVGQPLVELFIPTRPEVNRGEGSFLIRDNGPGLDRIGLMRALSAGYSTQAKFGGLGLFGVGFNIATGKIGCRTVVTTARAQDDFATRATLDLPEMSMQGDFKPPNETIPKPEGMNQGTWVEVDSWWPSGHGNADFIKTMANVSQARVLESLGRRYGTLLRGDAGDVKIGIEVYSSHGSDPDPVVAYEHCVWDEERFVEDRSRAKFGLVSAQIHFDDVIGSTRRCKKDGTTVATPANSCPQCQSGEFVTIEERIRGWVGIQRFDDTNSFGVDVIRNGRTILTGEKEAFFSREDDLGQVTREYPVDDQTGRIVGEVHIDHAQVDFLKQRFERDEAWSRAMEFVRGLSLQWEQWPDGYVNDSPVSKLNSAYKKIRVKENGARASLYMGEWDPVAKKPKRIGREVEREFYKKFKVGEPGFYDDAEWWKLVEGADRPPPPQTVPCHDCGFQNRNDATECGGCGHLLQSKACVVCTKEIPLLATSCPECGNDQVGADPKPWTCQGCGDSNHPEDVGCGRCELPKGSPHPTSQKALVRIAQTDDDLSRSNWTIRLANGETSSPLDLKVWWCPQELKPTWGGPAVPLVSFKEPGNIEVFLDATHPVFGDLQVKPVELVAAEAAQYLYEINRNLMGNRGHSISALASAILEGLWGDELSASPEVVRTGVNELIEDVARRLEGLEETTDFYRDLRDADQKELATGIVNAGKMDELHELLESGGYLAYMPPRYFSAFFSHYPECWMAHVWSISLPNSELVGHDIAEQQQTAAIGFVGRCLGDCAALLEAGDMPASEIVERARSGLASLEDRLR